MGFTVLDGKIWIRVYEIKETEATKSDKDGDTTEADPSKSKRKSSSTGKKEDTKISLVEIGKYSEDIGPATVNNARKDLAAV